LLIKGRGQTCCEQCQLELWKDDLCPDHDAPMNAVRTILFVENDPVALQMYSHRLEREGFHIDSAQDGLEALKRISQLAPDLVVLDRMLPRLSGDDVLKFIRADPRLKTLPVVVFTNAPVSELAPDMALAGPTRQLLKSDCTFPMLLQTIQDSLNAAPNDPSFSASSPDTATLSPQPENGQPAPAAPIPDEPPKDRGRFLSDALAEMPKLRECCFAYIKAPASPASLQHFPNLYQRVHLLSTAAAQEGYARVALLTGAFDVLLSEILVKPSWVTPSVLQTIAQAVDGLGLLLKSDEADLAKPMPQAKVLAVDDDAVCAHVIVKTLKRAGFDAKSVNDPLIALQWLEKNPCDLVLLDISMPGLTGFELCEKLRRFPHCKTVPVIFITGHNNFDNRKQSVLSGGHDFIIKPISASELALKATLHLLKAQTPPLAAVPAASEPLPEELLHEAPRATASTRSSPQPGTDVKGVVPATALLPVTESGSSDAQKAASPVVPALSGDPIPEPVAEEALQPAIAVPIHRPQITAARNQAPAGALPLAWEPSGSDTAAMPAGGKTTFQSESHETFDKIVLIVARIMFGDEGLTEWNVRLTRAALERYHVHEILNGAEGDSQDPGRNPQ
jgi:CheY-like chemotaxis protein